jgi:hypothetical protein
MTSTQTSNVRIFFDHLYFSVCCILVGFLLVYFIARWTEHGFSLDDNIAVCVVAVTALSLILAVYLTLVSLSKATSEYIVRTKRTR